jgi:hypothetical protein
VTVEKQDFLAELSELGRLIHDEAFESVRRKVEETDYETRLAVTAWAMKHIVEHASEGGSYRTLIYQRLGFGPDAYAVLQFHGGLEISNEFDLSRDEKVLKIVREHKFEPLKEVLGLCDEPDCFKKVSCGWPEESTGLYRRTCGDHYRGKLSKKGKDDAE